MNKTYSDIYSADSYLYRHYGPENYAIAQPGFMGIISAASGSGKSTLMEPIIASCVADNSVISNWQFKSFDNTVVHIDTELPRDLYEAQSDRIFDLSGVEPNVFDNRYKYFNVVDQVSFAAKRAAVKEIINTEVASLYVIDNITGLCDPNDKETAYKMAYSFNALASDKNCIVIAVGHVNNRNTERGWLGRAFKEVGSFAFILDLYKDIGVTVVTPDKDRIGGMPTTAFSVNEYKQVVDDIYMPFPL